MVAWGSFPLVLISAGITFGATLIMRSELRTGEARLAIGAGESRAIVRPDGAGNSMGAEVELR